MPLSGLEMARTRRILYHMMAPRQLQISNTQIRTGGSAAPDPERSVTLHHRCCSSQQTVLIATSLMHPAKNGAKVRMRERKRAVDAENAESTEQRIRKCQGKEEWNYTVFPKEV